MHPKSKDRGGNLKVFADAREDRKDAKSGPGGQRFRHSKYGARLAAMRARLIGQTHDEEE